MFKSIKKICFKKENRITFQPVELDCHFRQRDSSRYQIDSLRIQPARKPSLVHVSVATMSFSPVISETILYSYASIC